MAKSCHANTDERCLERIVEALKGASKDPANTFSHHQVKALVLTINCRSPLQIANHLSISRSLVDALLKDVKQRLDTPTRSALCDKIKSLDVQAELDQLFLKLLAEK
jgi:DNA-binding CsgD family transcriptional regulator